MFIHRRGLWYFFLYGVIAIHSHFHYDFYRPIKGDGRIIFCVRLNDGQGFLSY